MQPVKSWAVLPEGKTASVSVDVHHCPTEQTAVQLKLFSIQRHQIFFLPREKVPQPM
jgi:hypothetical protein